MTAAVRAIAAGGAGAAPVSGAQGSAAPPASAATEDTAPEPAPAAGGLVIPNPEAEILPVRAIGRRHREIRAYLDEVLASARRKRIVLILDNPLRDPPESSDTASAGTESDVRACVPAHLLPVGDCHRAVVQDYA